MSVVQAQARMQGHELVQEGYSCDTALDNTSSPAQFSAEKRLGEYKHVISLPLEACAHVQSSDWVQELSTILEDICKQGIFLSCRLGGEMARKHENMVHNFLYAQPFKLCIWEYGAKLNLHLMAYIV